MAPVGVPRPAYPGMKFEPLPLGIEVLRFWNRQVHTQIDTVRLEIWQALMKRTGSMERTLDDFPKRES